MNKIWACLAVTLALAPEAALTQQLSEFSTQLCLFSEGPAAYAFWQGGKSATRLINGDGATVTVSGPTTTVVLGDTVLQFRDQTVQVLKQEKLEKWPCLDISNVIIGVMELMDAKFPEIQNTEKDNRLREAEKTRLADLAAAEALRERLRNSDAELTAMTLALEEQRRRAEETLTLLAAAQASAEAAKVEGSDKAMLISTQN